MPDKVLTLASSFVDSVRPPTPEGPKQLQQRRSCELVNTPSPCVKKALFHLEKIKILINTKCPVDDKKVQELQQKLSDSILKTEGQGTIKKQLRFFSPPSSVPSGDHDFEVLSQEHLSVKGLGTLKNGAQEIETMFTKIQLTPQEVFTQVAELLRRLEDDRTATERALEHERNRLRNLTMKIDDISQRRLTVLPIAVQKEHEACAVDITELRWHVSYTERQLERSKKKVQAAQLLNANLLKDIDFVKRHCPLVSEKLVMEKEAMKNIRDLQKEVDSDLATTRIDLDKAEQKYQLAQESAERERQQTRADLAKIRNQLKVLEKDLKHSEAMHQAYVKKAEQSRQKLSAQSDELGELEVKIGTLREAEQNEIYRIEELRDEAKQVESETGEINRQRKNMEIETENMHKEMQEKLLVMENRYKDSLRHLRELQESNREVQYDIEDLQEESKACDKAIVKAEREIDRFHKERERCETQMKIAGDEANKISMINSELKAQLNKDESKSQAMEDALKSTAENLRKQVNDEMRQKSVFETKRQHNTQALAKGKSDNAKKKDKVERALRETRDAADQAAKQVQSLQKEHNAVLQSVAVLKEKLSDLKEEHEMTEKTLTEQKQKLQPIENKLQQEQTKLRDEIKEMESSESQMKQKLFDMGVSKKAMEKRISTADANIAKLTEEHNEVEIQFEASKAINARLQEELRKATERLMEREKRHKAIMNERGDIKNKLEDGVKTELTTNTEVAQAYRELQTSHIDMKNRFMNLFDIKVKLESSIKDHKQLLKLQEKLNAALKQYYHDRGAYNKAGLAKFYEQTKSNSDMMRDVQKGLEVAIDNISLFLKSQVDGSAVNKVHKAARDWLDSP